VSSYRIISEVSRLLKQTLWSGFDGDAALTQHVPDLDSIVLINPAENPNQLRRISLWLYQVQENEFLRNKPKSREPNDDARVRYPPLPLNLFYLLTPSTNDVVGDQLVLGRAMQLFHDNAILRLENPDEPAEAEELRITMCQRDLRELAEVWEALQQPYRLSVCYEVRVPRIESLRTERVQRIEDRSFAFEENATGGAQ
jgi:hypothetical protein